MKLSPKEEAALSLIKEDPAYENYFFNKVADLKWFCPLKERGYFSADKAPAPKPADEKGYFIIPQWNVLDYLEKVSQQVKISGNEKYINELLMIIKEVTSYKDVSGRHIDNYRTWWYFIKILLKFPNEKIPIEILDLVPIWLNSKFGTGLHGSDIVTKLLPKFLPDEPTPADIKKAENLIKYVTKIKWDKPAKESRNTLLYTKAEPKTIIDTHWLKESFITKKNALKIGEKCTDGPIYFIADKLKTIFRKLHPKHFDDIEVEDKIHRITVYHKKDYEFDFEVGILNKEQLGGSESKDEFLALLSAKAQDPYRFKISKCKSKENFVMRAITEISELKIINSVGKDLQEKLANLYETIFRDYSNIWFESIAEGPELHIFEAKEILTLILRDIVLGTAKKNKAVVQEVFINFLSTRYQYSIFKRIILFVIGECWEDYRKEFWKFLEDKGGEEIFDDPHYEAEIYTLLESNVKKLRPEEKTTIMQIIAKGPQRYLPEERKNEYLSYWKQKWYSALKLDEEFLSLYEGQKAITHLEEEIRFKEPHSKWGPGPSPLTKEEILQMSNDELAQFFTKFETKDFWKGPTVDGLSDTLRAAVMEKPEKFCTLFSPFLNSPYLYIYEILWGIKDAWSNKKAIEWEKLFDFLKKYIERDDFWHDKFKLSIPEHKDADHEWVSGMIGELIEAGTQDDKWAFDESYLPIAQKILFCILDNLKKEAMKEEHDPMMDALNTPFGKIITALINLALRKARLGKQRGTITDIKWSEDIKNKYEKLLNDKITEAYTLLGLYMPNFYYLDKVWVEQKIKEFESIEEQELWQAFMAGYFYISTVYNGLYELMRNHYLKAINYPFKEDHSEERIVQHLAVGYLRGVENLSADSLFGIMLEGWEPSQVIEVIDFFWTQRGYFEKVADSGDIEIKKQNDRIIDFWRYIFSKYKDKKEINEDDKKILSSVSRLTKFLPKIDAENISWLMLSARYVNVNFNSPFFIESLDGLKNKGNKIESAKFIAKIFLEMLNEFTPDFDEKHIKSIVENLYTAGDESTKDLADKICDVYARKRFEFLTDIWEKYRS